MKGRCRAPRHPTPVGLSKPVQPDDPVSLGTLRRHSLGLLVVLTALTPLFNGRFIAFPDEGVYAAQAALLADGSWSGRRPLAEVDTEGAFDPLRPEIIDGERHVPYARHPLYPLLLAASYQGLGTPGLLALSTIGVLVAAVFTALTAERLCKGTAIRALWLTGLGSPLVFDAYLAVGQGLAAACAAMSVWAIVAAVEDRRRRPLAWLFVATTAAGMVRSEGVAFALALAVGAAAAAKRRTPRGFHAVAAAVAVTGAATAFLADRAWRSAISTPAGLADNPLGRDADPWSSAWNDLVRPWLGRPDVLDSVVVLMTALLLVSALSLRLRRSSDLLPIAAGGLAAALAVGYQFTGPRPVNALVPAFPVIAFALVSTPRRQMASSHLLVAAATVAYIGGVAAVTYGVGGVTQWGGRFYHLAVPLLVPLIGIGEATAQRSLGHRQRIAMRGFAAVVSVSLAGGALRFNHSWRSITEELVTASLDRLAHPASSAHQRPLLYVSRLPSGTSRVYWNETYRGDLPILHTAGLANLPRVLRTLTASGGTSALVVTPLDATSISTVLTANSTGWSVTSSERTGNGFTFVAVDRPGSGTDE